MKRTAACLAAAIICVAVCSTAHAIVFRVEGGEWPATWPQELEPLRKQSHTIVGPHLSQHQYRIPFATQEEFESAWPYLLKVKSPGAPVFLVREPQSDIFTTGSVSVLIHARSRSADLGSGIPEGPLANSESNIRGRWYWTTYIELVVDGEIVDLNRIPLPADTPIIDERFEKDAGK